MGVSAGLYMYDVVLKKSSRSLSHLLMSFLSISFYQIGQVRQSQSSRGRFEPGPVQACIVVLITATLFLLMAASSGIPVLNSAVHLLVQRQRSNTATTSVQVAQVKCDTAATFHTLRSKVITSDIGGRLLQAFFIHCAFRAELSRR